MSKLSNSDVTIFLNYDCDCIHHFLCSNAQWLSKVGKQCSGFYVFGDGLMPMKDCQIQKLFLFSVSTLCASNSQSPPQISSTDNKILPLFSVHFSNPYLKVRICGGGGGNKNNFEKNYSNLVMKSDNEMKLRSLM